MGIAEIVFAFVAEITSSIMLFIDFTSLESVLKGLGDSVLSARVAGGSTILSGAPRPAACQARAR